jgi:Flp pilus assembly protein TadD
VRTCTLIVLAAALLAPVQARPAAADNVPRGGAARTPPETADPSRDEPESAPVAGPDLREEAYLAALRQLAGGERAAAVQALAELERAVVAAESLPGVTDLHRQVLDLARRLSRGDGARLRPILWLHSSVARSYVSGRDQILRHAARQLVADLADLMWHRASTPADRVLAEQTMIALGFALLDTGKKEAATALFYRALRLDGDHPTALLAIGAIHERQGRNAQAARFLGRLVEAHPDHAEGRLRLAVNLERTGDSESAREHLRSLVGGPAPEWIRSVAVQQLARSLVADGRAEEAEATLRSAVAELPSDHTLRIQLAWVVDLRGRPSESGRLVEAIEPDHAQPKDAPRWRYARWPAFDRGAVARQLAELPTAATEHLLDELDPGSAAEST